MIDFTPVILVLLVLVLGVVCAACLVVHRGGSFKWKDKTVFSFEHPKKQEVDTSEFKKMFEDLNSAIEELDHSMKFFTDETLRGRSGGKNGRG